MLNLVTSSICRQAVVVADDFGTGILERDRTSRDRYITLFILAVMAAGMLVLHMRVATSSVF